MNTVRVGGVSGLVPLRAMLTVLLASLLVLAGCGQQPTPKAAPKPTPLAELPVAGVEIPRIEFCSLVHPRTISTALGLPATKLPRGVAETSYGNGDQLDLGPAGDQRVQELGCTWTLGTESVAAWIFARPVEEPFAQTILASAREQRRCTLTEGGFGKPGFGQQCPQANGLTRIRHAGLFGQTWLTCQVTGSDQVAERAELWCSSLVNELKTRS